MAEKDLQKTLETVLAEQQTIKIIDQESLEKANLFLTTCKQTSKFVEDHFSDELKEAQEKKKAAEAERKAVVQKIEHFTVPLGKAERTVKSQISAYLTEQERQRREEEARRRREEEERRLAEAVETGEEEILDKPITYVKPPEPELAKGTYTVDVWEFEIVDKAKINPAYLIPDTKAIGAAVRSMKDRAQEALGEGVKVICRKDIRQRI
ncbi:hypothetical protein B4O97_03590 [Marispirochaeta aestuarii]|uniref:Uncharacterized protein n=1 Tax=Marispirochaeta aestuarii TaxID=1963862 RepID=A0A1Y1S2J2_9SPIO|nr:hypothetical protein [Marispirochaeta aestuarii]ORC37285.1 hypothetical protein B4O97_03590 [Marispirochaeta aestuarii]